MKLRALGALLAACVMAFGVDAAAATMTATWRGTITSGQDFGGVFGGGDLTGQTFSLALTYDTARGARIMQDYGDDHYSDSVEGVAGASPITAGALTIAGHTDVFSPEFLAGLEWMNHTWQWMYHFVYLDPAKPTNAMESYLWAEGTDGDRYDFLYLDAQLQSWDALPKRLDQPYSGVGEGDVTFNRMVGSLTTMQADDVYLLYGRAESLVVAAAAPEPGTWALMILGFGGAGAMLRRRRYALA